MNARSVALLVLIGVVGGATASLGQGPAPRPRCTVTVVATGYRGWLTDSLHVVADPESIRLERRAPDAYRDYKDFSGSALQEYALFREVPVPPALEPYPYEITVTYLGHYRRKKYDPDHDNDDDLNTPISSQHEFRITRHAKVPSDALGHDLTWRIDIHSYDVPKYY